MTVIMTVKFVILWYFRKSDFYGSYPPFNGKPCWKSESEAAEIPPNPFHGLLQESKGQEGLTHTWAASVEAGKCSSLFLDWLCLKKKNVVRGIVEYSSLFLTSVIFRSGVGEKSPLLTFNNICILQKWTFIASIVAFFFFWQPAASTN